MARSVLAFARLGGVVVTRKLVCLAGLIGLVLVLAGCDRCGQWEDD